MKNFFLILIALTLTSCLTQQPQNTSGNTTEENSHLIISTPYITQNTALYKGPGNDSFEIIAELKDGSPVLPLGVYQDFVKVEIPEGYIGFVRKELVSGLPNELPELNEEDVPWIKVNINDDLNKDYAVIEGDTIIMENLQETGIGWEGGSTLIDAPFRIRINLNTPNPKAGHANIQLIGTPHKSNKDNWWEYLIDLETSIDFNGNLRICIRDGSSENCAYDQSTSIQNGQSFTLLFDDPQGKDLHILDQQGDTALSINTSASKELNLPNGLFPEKKFWLGGWASPGVKLTISPFLIEKKPSGRWDPNTDNTLHIPFSSSVITEERFIDFENPANGVTPLWNRGASVIARQGEGIFISMIKTYSEFEKPNNVKCELYERTFLGWKLIFQVEEPTREPCPITTSGESLYLSTNQSLEKNSLPEIMILKNSYRTILQPEWQDGHHFTAWSYRGIGMDPDYLELFLLNISDEGYYWSFLDNNGQWSRNGLMAFPKNAYEDNPLRLSYPNVILRNRLAYIMTVSDVMESNNQYLNYMINDGIDFYYVFRNLYYAWTPDIARQDPSTWKLLASAEPYGYIENQDIWVAEDGSAHFIWIEKNVDDRLLSHLPGELDTQTLWHAVIRNGVVISRTPLMEYDTRGIRPVRARFHSLPNGRLFIFLALEEVNGDTTNHLMELYSDETLSTPNKIYLNSPLNVFQIASQQNGSTPSPYLDIIGLPEWGGTTLNYVRIKIK